MSTHPMSEHATHCICGHSFGRDGDLPMDGPRNSDIETECNHWLCTDCWSRRRDNNLPLCPLCSVDISEWLFSEYPLDNDESASDSSSEDESVEEPLQEEFSEIMNE